MIVHQRSIFQMPDREGRQLGPSAPAVALGFSAFAYQTASNLMTSASIAFSDASKNVAENVPRLILLAMLASVSFRPHFFSRSASSRYPISARANSALRNRFARSSQEGGFAAIVILPHLNNIYHIRYFTVDKHIIYDILIPDTGDMVMLDVRR